MKRILNGLAFVATVAMTLISCSKEVNEAIDNPTGKMKTIKVSTAIVETKTTLDSDHANLVWASGDKISLFNDVDESNTSLTYAKGGDIEIEVPEATTEIYAHYPYYSGNKTGPKTVSVYISNKQTQENPGELNGYYYPMVAKGTVSEDNKALISFYPVASALALNIYNSNLDGTELLSSITATPAEANTYFIGRQTTDITVDNVQYTSAASSDPITVSLSNYLSLGSSAPSDKQKFDGQIYVCLAKQSYASVKFEITTTKGVYTITSSADNAFDCINNDFIPVNINLAKASFAAAEDLSGTYAILAKSEDTYYAMANTHNNNTSRLDEASFSEIPTFVNDKAFMWTVEKQSDGTYSITDADGKYLTASSSNNANVGTDAKYCSISANDDAFSIKQNGRILARNNTALGFAFYESGQNNTLYLAPIEYKALPSFVWGDESTAIEPNDNNEHTVTLTISDFTSVSSVKVYDEDETTEVSWLVASYADGKVTFQAEENTGALRKAVIVVTAVNDNGSASSKITITQKKAASGGGETHPYSFTITMNDFNSTSYAANNNMKTTTATATDGSGLTMDVDWTSNQVYQSSSVMQWQKNTGCIYNNTDLGTITSITITSDSGTFTTYYGDTEQPSESTEVGGPYFQIKVGNATGKTTEIKVEFTN